MSRIADFFIHCAERGVVPIERRQRRRWSRQAKRSLPAVKISYRYPHSGRLGMELALPRELAQQIHDSGQLSADERQQLSELLEWCPSDATGPNHGAGWFPADLPRKYRARGGGC